MPIRTAASLILLAFALVAPALGQGADEASAKRLLAQAQRIAATGDLAAAAREMRMVRQQFPNTSSATEALLAEAKLHLDLGDRTAARRVASELIDGWTRSSAAAGAMVLVAELDLADAGSRDAVERIRTQVSRVPLLYSPEAMPHLPARTRAQVLSGTLALRLGELERGVGTLLAAAEDESFSEALPAARLALARAFLATGRWNSAAWWAQRASASESTRQAARNLLANIERLEVRAGRNQPPWRTTTRLNVGGLDASRGLKLAAAPNGSILVADDRTGARELALDGGVVGSTNATEVVAVVFGLDGSGWLVLPDRLVGLGGSQVRCQNPDDASKVLDRLTDAAPDPWGSWYVLDERRDRVVHCERTGRSLGVVAGVGTRPVALASDALGRVHVLDRKAGTVTRIDPSGATSVVVRHAWKDPIDLAVDGAGRIAVLDEDGPKVMLFRADGSPLTTLVGTLPGNGGPLSRPTAIALDAAGRLVVADRKSAALTVSQ